MAPSSPARDRVAAPSPIEGNSPQWRTAWNSIIPQILPACRTGYDRPSTRNWSRVSKSSGSAGRRDSRHWYRRPLLASTLLIGVVLVVLLIPPPWFDLWATFFGSLPAVARDITLAFVVVQLALLAVAEVRSWLADRRTRFALTDRRVIVTEPRPLRPLAFGRRLLNLWSYDPGQLRTMVCEEAEDGSGDLVLAGCLKTHTATTENARKSQFLPWFLETSDSLAIPLQTT
jgi:hypothetical protein